MKSRSIIIDTDPGQDDAVALLLALASPELEVLGITTVAGNVPLALTTRNACIMLELIGRRDVPVYAGAIRPMVRPLVTAEYVHGKTGLDGPILPEPTMTPSFGDAVAASPRHVGAGFMARRTEIESGVEGIESSEGAGVYGQQLWNYYCRSYPDNVARHHPDAAG